MNGHSMTTSNGTYEVAAVRPRCGGAVDVIVAFTKDKVGARTVYKAFRREPGGDWKALNGLWVSVEVALREVPYTRRYALVAADWMKDFLTAALDASELDAPSGAIPAEHAARPTWEPWSRAEDPGAFADRSDYDEGDEVQ